MGSEIPKLHIFIFPLMAQGHMIPAMDMARLFGSRRVKTTIITTPVNASFFLKEIQRLKDTSIIEIDIKILKFPTTDAGLPEGCENLDAVVSMEMFNTFFKATTMLEQPLELLMQECKPDCLVADMLYPWTAEVAAKFGIPRLVFPVTSFLTMCTTACLTLYEPHKRVSSDSETFVVTNLPGDIKLTRNQLSKYEDEDDKTEFGRLLKAGRDSESDCYGVVVNSFYELESDYVDYYRKVMGRRAWHIGPLSLSNRSVEDEGKQASIDEHECLKWLNSKKPDSVIYICFGSEAKFTSDQLMEIALGLEASGQQFIWVVRRKGSENEKEDWLPDGFENRMEGKGLIIRGWAPQVLILDHEATGGFMTHCGWNSILEGVAAGLPMVAWPLSAEQFYNEKLVTQVLKIGVGVGVEKWATAVGDFVKWEAIERAMKGIMTDDGAEGMRKKAKELGDMARRAIGEGGSSYLDFDALIDDLRRIHASATTLA